MGFVVVGYLREGDCACGNRGDAGGEPRVTVFHVRRRENFDRRAAYVGAFVAGFSASEVTTTTEQASGTGGGVKRHSMALAALAAAVVFQLALMAAYTGANARPVLHHVTIGLVGPSPTPGGDVSSLSDNTVSYQPVSDAATARHEVSDGRLPAALIVAGSHQRLVIAEAGGLALTAAVEQIATTEAAAAQATLAVEDVRPLPAGDPRGFATYLLVLGWILGGYVGMTLLTRMLRPRAPGMRGTATLTAWTAAYAVASAGLGVVLMDPLMGTVTGHPWALLGAGTVIVFAAAMSTAALMSLFGIAGIVVAVVIFVLLGNPSSGGSVPVQMLSGGFQFLAKILPNNAGVALVQRVEYFDGNQLGHPLVVLGLYAVIATAVCFADALRRSRSAPAEQPSEDVQRRSRSAPAEQPNAHDLQPLAS
jgi:hypothetical protein